MADVFGRMVADYHRDDLAGQPVYERSDGDESPAHCAWYFAGPEDWGPLEDAAIDACRGRVLDAGCGPGRALGVLGERGHDVLGIDESPGAIVVAREWTGEPVVVGDMARLPLGDAGSDRTDGRADSPPDTALFMGTHVGAPGSIEGLRALLAEYDRVLARDGRIVADIYDPTAVEDEAIQDYLEDRWLADGVATRRFRLRYDGAVGAWRTLLQCSPAALERIVEPNAWTITDVERGEGTRYVFVLERA